MNKNDREEVTEIVIDTMRLKAILDRIEKNTLQVIQDENTQPVTVNRFAAFAATCFFVATLAYSFTTINDVPHLFGATVVNAASALLIWITIQIFFTG